MTNLKSHHSPTSATALHRAYIYLPASQWDAVDSLRANTTMSVSQYIAYLISAASAAKASKCKH